MAITSRPIDTYLEDTEIDINGLFHYNFNDKIGDDFAVSAINYTNESIEGIKFAASPQKEETVVRFGDTDYMFHGFILTKDVDTTTEDYALMIELNSSNFTKRMFVQFPLVISDKDKESDADDLMSLIEIVDENDNAFKPITNEKINPNKWFPTNKGYRFYTFKNENTIFVLFDDQLSITQRNKEILDDTYNKYFSDGTQMESAASGTIYENTSTSSVKQINISDAEFQDIYIECSPEGDNVIRPQKVFTIRKLFDFGNNKESFVSNVEGFDADNIPEISRQFGIFLVGMVIFGIVYFAINRDQFPQRVKNIIQNFNNNNSNNRINAFEYTIYFLTVLIAFCSLFFLMRDKPEIEDYKTRFGALEIKGIPLVWFITILFGFLFAFVIFGDWDSVRNVIFKWADISPEQETTGKILIFLFLVGIVILCFFFGPMIYLMIKSDVMEVKMIVWTICFAVFISAFVLGILLGFIKKYGLNMDSMDSFRIGLKDLLEQIRIKKERSKKDEKTKITLLFMIIHYSHKALTSEPFKIMIFAIFIYVVIYSLTYLMLFYTTPIESLNLKSIAVFSLFISFLCYVHIYLKSLYDFFISSDEQEKIKDAAKVAAIAATQNKVYLEINHPKKKV